MTKGVTRRKHMKETKERRKLSCMDGKPKGDVFKRKKNALTKL